jgi:hypothetical protein
MMTPRAAHLSSRTNRRTLDARPASESEAGAGDFDGECDLTEPLPYSQLRILVLSQRGRRSTCSMRWIRSSSWGYGLATDRGPEPAPGSEAAGEQSFKSEAPDRIRTALWPCDPVTRRLAAHETYLLSVTSLP